MHKIAYIERRFTPESMRLIEIANQIIQEYRDAGFDLTLRQLYYQFVARDHLENSERSYKRLGGLVNDGRMAGLIDWRAIVDRTRNVVFQSHWDSPQDILASCANSFAVDKWEGQPYRVEVWIEKEALAGVLQSVCPELDVPYFSCRGYVSQSEQWRAAMRMRGYKNAGQNPYIIHLGDHDPSGIDMTRDIRVRLKTFGCDVEVNRIALNMPQIEEHQPPPNPAKTVDPRFANYSARYGDESWELDALNPQLLARLVSDAVLAVRDEKIWEEREAEEEEHRAILQTISEEYDSVRDYLNRE